MKKILIIPAQYGNTAPAIVYKNYIKYLVNCEKFHIEVFNPFDDIAFTRPQIHHRLRKLSIMAFSLDIFDFLYARKLAHTIDIDKFDIIFSMISAHNYFPLYMASNLKKNKPSLYWINYSVDAIPHPKGWGNSRLYRLGASRMIRKFFKRCNKILFSNKSMLEYEVNILGKHFNGRSGVLYTLPSLKIEKLPKNKNEEITFLYTGGIYQARKPDEVLLAFELLLEKGIDAKFEFVGTDPKSLPLHLLKSETLSKITISKFTSDLSSFYQNADILVDIDADIKNDVFISSKFFNYLMVNRKILCITSKESPVSQLIELKKLNHIYISNHSRQSILNTMLTAIQAKNNTSEIDRPKFFLEELNEFLKLEG